MFTLILGSIGCGIGFFIAYFFAAPRSGEPIKTYWRVLATLLLFIGLYLGYKTYEHRIEQDIINNKQNEKIVKLEEAIFEINKKVECEITENRLNNCESTIDSSELKRLIKIVQENSNDFLALGNAAYLSGKYHEAIKWFTKAADQGDTKAQINLGVMYIDGKGVKKDKRIAFEWFTKAAEQGNASSQFNLGVMYNQGDGVKKDKRIAFEWFTKAAEQGVADAQFMLGAMYAKGDGVKKDKRIAFEWISKAAEQGNVLAQFSLGVMYDEGEGVKEDKRLAFVWISKAAEQGNAEAQFDLGILYAKGEGVKEDKRLAFEWFKKAAEQGNVEAQKVIVKLTE